MGKFVVPKAFLIAETRVNHDILNAALTHLGVPEWKTDAADDHSLLSEFAGKSCYMSFDTSLNLNLTRTGTRDNETYLQEGIIGQKHGSVLEHSTVTFFITNVSRVVTHELIRHRAGTAFSQTSGRYVRTEEIDMYLPNVIASHPELAEVFQYAVHQMEDNLAELAEKSKIEQLSFKLKKKLTSAFRRLVGNGQANHIVFTANHRALRHIIEVRTHASAEEEIRVVFAGIFEILRSRFPALYADAVVYEEDGLPVVSFEHQKV